jgi:predicted dehydrogenase
MDKVRVAVLGCGVIAEKVYLPKIMQMNRASLVAVCDVIGERAEASQRRYGVPRSYTHLDDMLAEEGFDLLVNLTNIPVHYDLNLQVLQAGKHLYSEKPLAYTVEQATELIELARARGVKLGSAPPTMLCGVNARVRSLIEEGAIGKVAFAKIFSSHGGAAYYPAWPNDPTWFHKKGSGPLLDLGVYGLHTITGILGPVKRLSAYSGISDPVRYVRGGPYKGKRIEVEEDDLTLVTLDFGDTTFATIDGSFCVRASRTPFMEIYGADGTITANPMYWIGEGSPLSLWRDDVKLGVRGWTEVQVQPEEMDWTVADGVKHLVDCILEDREPIISGEHARHVVEIMAASKESARTGRSRELATTF